MSSQPSEHERPPEHRRPPEPGPSSEPGQPTAAAATTTAGATTGKATTTAAATPTTTTDQRSLLASWFDGLPPAAGSAVMATGIVSIGLRSVGAHLLSAVALALAALGWLALADDFVRRFARQRRSWTAQSHTPPALTAVASTTVLGVRVSLEGWQPLAVGLLVIATLLWPPLLWSVLRHLRPHMQGAVFLVCVATQGLVTLAATLAAALPARWLLWPALVLFVLGLALYVDAMEHFDFAAIRDGAGDHWVAGGALAISALACAKLLEAASGSWAWPEAVHGTLRVVDLVLLAMSWTWYAVLAVAEIRWPRPYYDVRRWATVFPLGMTAVATIETAKATGWTWLTGIGHTLVWIGAAAWLLTFVGFLRKATGRLRADDRE